MTAIEKEKIAYYRSEGLGYKAIAAKLSLTESMVKGHCRRNGLTGNAEDIVDTVCRQCGIPLKADAVRTRKFCSDNCRAVWWNRHPYLAGETTNNQQNCAYCGSLFYGPPGRYRKYCSHPCYIAMRYGKAKNDDD